MWLICYFVYITQQKEQMQPGVTEMELNQNVLFQAHNFKAYFRLKLALKVQWLLDKI